MENKRSLKTVYSLISIILLLFILIISCKNSSGQNEANYEKEATDPLVSKQQNENLVHQTKKRSFVLSCGSGCAMTYDEESVIQNEFSFTVKFHVTMYINEVVSDVYYETYLFDCNKSGNLIIARLKEESENLLESEDSIIKDELKKYGKMLCSGISK